MPGDQARETTKAFYKFPPAVVRAVFQIPQGNGVTNALAMERNSRKSSLFREVRGSAQDAGACGDLRRSPDVGAALRRAISAHGCTDG